MTEVVAAVFRMFGEAKFTINHHLTLDAHINDMSGQWKDVQQLGFTVMPLYYAQVMRWAVVLFLGLFSLGSCSSDSNRADDLV